MAFFASGTKETTAFSSVPVYSVAVEVAKALSWAMVVKAALNMVLPFHFTSSPSVRAGSVLYSVMVPLRITSSSQSRGSEPSKAAPLKDLAFTTVSLPSVVPSMSSKEAVPFLMAMSLPTTAFT